MVHRSKRLSAVHVDQGSPTFLNLRATAWAQSHTKGNQFAKLSPNFSQLAFNSILICVKTLINNDLNGLDTIELFLEQSVLSVMGLLNIISQIKRTHCV